jgi:hypothetical protein
LAFAVLKEALSTALVLHLPDFTKPFTVDWVPQAPALAQCYIKVPVLWHYTASCLQH